MNCIAFIFYKFNTSRFFALSLLIGKGFDTNDMSFIKVGVMTKSPIKGSLKRIV